MWSGRGDLNSRPPAPKAGASPNCATPRTARSVAVALLMLALRWGRDRPVVARARRARQPAFPAPGGPGHRLHARSVARSVWEPRRSGLHELSPGVAALWAACDGRPLGELIDGILTERRARGAGPASADGPKQCAVCGCCGRWSMPAPESPAPSSIARAPVPARVELRAARGGPERCGSRSSLPTRTRLSPARTWPPRDRQPASAAGPIVGGGSQVAARRRRWWSCWAA